MNAPINQGLRHCASTTPQIVVSSLKALGDVPHRIEWFGQILRGTTTCVSVVFAPWVQDASTGEMRAASDQHVTLALPVAYLRLFRIGDIWRGGMNTGFRDLVTRETFDLNIEEGTVEVKPAGLPLRVGAGRTEYPLPFSAFGGHKEHTHAQCARIALDDSTTLVIPCMELIRFYFGGSGSFLKRLFSGAFALDKLFVRARLNPTTGTANIDLAEDLVGTAAVTVARIAFDKQARSAASWIVNSGVAAAANKNRYYPKTTFPFHGTTRLTMDGRWIDNGGHRVFLAEQLVCCTHAFPFKTLYYTTRRSPISRPSLTHQSEPSESALAPEMHSPAAKLQEGSVSTQLQPASVPDVMEIVSPFPDLAGKRVCRVKVAAIQGPTPPPSDSPADLSTGMEASIGEFREAEVVSASDETVIDEMPPDAADVLTKAVRAFNAGPSPFQLLMQPQAGIDDELLTADGFVRVADETQHEGYIWYVVLKLRFENHAVGNLLAVIREHSDRDLDDHVRLISISDEQASDAKMGVNGIGQILHESANSGTTRLAVVETMQATNFASALRTLALGVQQIFGRFAGAASAVR